MSDRIKDIQEMSGEMFSSALHSEISKSIEDENQEFIRSSRQETTGPEGLTTLFAGDRLYSRTKSGHFEGFPTVAWNGIFEDNSKPKFIYRPQPANPFRFIRHDGQAIEPGVMDTDGGSIPRILHGFGRFDAWGYAPGYIVHDWIFTAHKCGHSPDDNISFEDSATILAECIKTLMEVGYTDFDGANVKLRKREDTMYLIYKAVSSFIARGLWNDSDNVNCR